MKTLDDAIGCWTVNPDYNSLPTMAGHILKTTRQCRSQTLRGNPQALKGQLHALRAKLLTMVELTDDAIRRLQQIIDTDELVT